MTLCELAYIFGRISHNIGFIFFLELLYCISPYLALLVGLHVGQWYLTSMIGLSFVGRICHTFGFCIFVHLLYSVSPHLALYFGLPCLLGFVAVMIAPSCPYQWKGLCNKVQELRDWWKHVNRPQSSVVIVQGSPFLRCEF